jgi:hypothetical protein
MRNCATVAEQFAQTISGIPLNPGADILGDEGQFATLPTRKRKGQTLEDGEGEGKRKKPKKLKDPNAPKRPASSYILFQNNVRGELKAKFPHLSNLELLQMIAQRWAAMSQADKEVYNKKNATEKEAYIAKKAAYDATGGGAGSAADVTVPKKKAQLSPKATVPVPALQASSSSDSSEESGSDVSSEEASGSEEEEEETPLPKKVAPAAPTSREKKAKKQKL